MWYFYSPSIIYGEDALNFLEKIPGKKCYIVTDKIIEETGLLKILTDKLDDLGKEYMIFNDLIPNPHKESAFKSKEKCLAYEPDLIIALGGGSVIDVAKATWAMYELPELNSFDQFLLNQEFFKINTGKKAKMVLIPTTSGTGSEATFGIILSTYEEHNNVWRKMEIPHQGLIPTFAIVDPIFPAKMPPKLTANTGFDALSHSLENIVSQWRNEISDALTLKAVELIFKYLPIAYKDGNNMEARDKMHLAATLAGLGFGNSLVHIGHTLGHGWGTVFNIPHGMTVGVFLPYVLQFCINNPDETDITSDTLGTMAKQLGWADWKDDNKKAANVLVEKIFELEKELDFPRSLQETGVSRSDLENNIDTLITLCFQSTVCTAGPRSPTMEEWKKLYTYAFEGKNIDF